MRRSMVSAAAMGALAFAFAGGAVAETKECSAFYKGKHSFFGIACDDAHVVWEPPPGFLKIKDTSWKQPLGGPNSFGNKTSEKLFRKPGRAIRKLTRKW